MKATHKLAMVFLGVLVAVTAAAAGFAVQQPAYAQLDPGASGFAPSANPDGAAGGWMPMEAPGHCIGCAEDSAPGNEALGEGVIGQPKKIE